jgi:hypothetical protein
MKQVTKKTFDGKAVASYKSVSEAARANAITVQRLYSHIQWRTPWQGHYYDSPDIPPCDRERRNAVRRAEYARSKPHKPRKPRAKTLKQPKTPRRPKPPKQPRIYYCNNGDSYDTRDIQRWLAIVPPEHRRSCEAVMKHIMAHHRVTTFVAFAEWYIAYDQIAISSDLIIATRRMRP